MVKKTTLLVNKDIHKEFVAKRVNTKMNSSEFLKFLIDNNENKTHIIQFVMDDVRYVKLEEISVVLVKNGLIDNNSIENVIDYAINNLIVGIQNVSGGMKVA